MNATRRKELEKAIVKIEEAKEIIESCKDEEQESFDNLTDNLQQSERGQKMENDTMVIHPSYWMPLPEPPSK